MIYIVISMCVMSIVFLQAYNRTITANERFILASAIYYTAMKTGIDEEKLTGSLLDYLHVRRLEDTCAKDLGDAVAYLTTLL